MHPLQHILFFDLETVPVAQSFEDLPPGLQAHWEKKSRTLARGADAANADAATLFMEKAAVFAEFAKVVCIGFGSFHLTEEGWRFRVKAITGDDEEVLLQEFCQVITKFTEHYKTDMFLAGHNVREFDVPFLCRRMILNGIGLPRCLQVQGKKSWELKHIEDTMELWKFGDNKNFTSLGLLAEILGIPTPKDDIDGSMVARVFWEDKDYNRISRYCIKDVITTAKVFLRLKGIADIPVEPLYVNA